MKNVPSILAAVDKKRNRIFVLAIPNVCAVKLSGVWHESVPVAMEEIDEYYDLVIDLGEAQRLVDEAKIALDIT